MAMLQISYLLVIVTALSVSGFTPTKRILVAGNFGTIDNLAKQFRPYGKIEQISLHNKKQPTPYAFVTFLSSESAKAAILHEASDLQISYAATAKSQRQQGVLTLQGGAFE